MDQYQLKYVEAVLTRLVALPTNEATLCELVLTGRDLLKCYKQGFTTSEAFMYFRNMEHFNPTLAEEVAMYNMAHIRAIVEQRTKVKDIGHTVTTQVHAHV